MKKLLITLAFFLFFSSFSSGQIYSPNLAGYAGPGTIFYPYGVYRGGVYNGFANGTGTFYWNDGSFFTGSYYGGLCHGAGVLVTRLYGYISGCWFNGVFAGNCTTTYNPYQDNYTVQNEVKRVQKTLPNDQRVSTFDPDGYKITQVDPNTEMGRTLLGKISK